MNLSRASPTQRRYGSLPTSADGEAMQATIGGGEDTFLRHDDYELAEARRCVLQKARAVLLCVMWL